MVEASQILSVPTSALPKVTCVRITNPKEYAIQDTNVVRATVSDEAEPRDGGVAEECDDRDHCGDAERDEVAGTFTSQARRG